MTLSHNHPRGNPKPSQVDRMLAQRLKEAIAKCARWIKSLCRDIVRCCLQSEDWSNPWGFGLFLLVIFIVSELNLTRSRNFDG
ncbi:JAB domain-containing protein [Pantoea allii]|uniref:JAB domain-containing protein n=1 Tax=Pantoea allii TaxID=574096 RepID=UPI0020B6840B|nr:JAB domain-containing protein [Pantoea allii]